MIKKLLNVFLCLSLLIQNFAFEIPVNAVTNEPVIKINGLEQGGEKLDFVDGNYIVDKYDEIYIDFELENTNSEDQYYIQILSENGGGSSFSYFGKDKYNFYVSPGYEAQQYTLNVCDNWECNEVYAQETFGVKIAFFNETINSKVIISDVYQGGKKVTLTDGYNLKLNNKQNISFKVKGENLIDDAKYRVSTGGSYIDEKTYLGSELEKGIEIKHYPNLSSNNFYFHVSMDKLQFYVQSLYSDGISSENIPFYISMNDDESLADYTYDFSYKNYPNIKINKSEYYYLTHYVINSNYHNADNPLLLNLKGTNFQDKDYEIVVKATKGNETLIELTKTVNGLLINEGYSLELKDLALEINKKLEQEDLYEFDITLNDISTKVEANYNSVGRDVTIGADIFFENGKKNLSAFRGDGNAFWGGGIYDTNKDVFAKYSKIYLRYFGENFKNNEEYEYILEYGNFEETTEYSDRNYEVELKTGKVNGAILNTLGILFEVDNYKNYENPTYRLTIKKGEEILYSSAPVLYIVDSPTLANASLSANNKNLYLQTSDQSYIATKNAPIDIVISGLGFEEDKTYDFEFCYGKIYEDDQYYEEGTCETIKIKGRDLNNGTAKIKFKEKIDPEAIAYNFYVMCDLQTSYQENVAIQGGFDVTFVDSKELFPNLKKYFVDNVSDLIKNITKNTSVKDFASNLEVVDNGSVKVFDQTGKHEVKDTVGTGMIARVLNEYDENVLDLDVVVKGDVSGDGNISITDLVKVKRHLAKTEKLDGVYEIAGNVSDTGNIGITDLVKISRDVANIQEVK